MSAQDPNEDGIRWDEMDNESCLESLDDDDLSLSDELSDSEEDRMGEELLVELRSLFTRTHDRSFGTPTSSADASFSSCTPEMARVLEGCINDLDEQKDKMLSTFQLIETHTNDRLADLSHQLQAAKKKGEDWEALYNDQTEKLSLTQQKLEDVQGNAGQIVDALLEACESGQWTSPQTELQLVDVERVNSIGVAISAAVRLISELESLVHDRSVERSGCLEQLSVAIRKYKGQPLLSDTDVTRQSTATIDEIAEERRQLEAEISSLRLQGEALEQQLASREKELHRLHCEVTNLHQQLATKDQNTADDLVAMQNLQQQYEACQKELSTLMHTMELLQPKVTELSDNVQQLDRELDLSKNSAQLEKEGVECSSDCLADLRKCSAVEAFSYQKELAKYDAALKKLHEESALFRAEYEDSVKKIDEKQAYIRELESFSQSCSEEVTHLKEEIKELQERLVADASKNASGEHQADEILSSELERERLVEKPTEKTAGRLTSKIRDVCSVGREQVEGLAKRLERCGSCSPTALSEAKLHVEEVLKQLQQEVLFLKDEVAEAEDKIHEHEGYIYRLDSALTSYRTDNEVAIEQKESGLRLEERLSQLQDEVSSNENMLKVIQSEKEVLQHSCREYDTKLSCCRTAVEELSSQCSNADLQINIQQMELEKLQKQLEEIEEIDEGEPSEEIREEVEDLIRKMADCSEQVEKWKLEQSGLLQGGDQEAITVQLKKCNQALSWLSSNTQTMNALHQRCASELGQCQHHVQNLEQLLSAS